MKSISREQLKQRLDGAEPFVLVEVLSPDKYQAFHLPGAINVPLERDFSRQIQRLVPDKHAPVVVYGWDRESLASTRAAMTMQNLGYEDVADYEAGKVDWAEAGLPVESSSRRAGARRGAAAR